MVPSSHPFSIEVYDYQFTQGGYSGGEPYVLLKTTLTGKGMGRLKPFMVYLW